MRETFSIISSSLEEFGDFKNSVKEEIEKHIKSYLRNAKDNGTEIDDIAHIDKYFLAELVIRVELILYGAVKIGMNEHKVLTIEDVSYIMTSPKFPHHEVYSEASKKIETFLRFNFTKKWGISSLIISDLMKYFKLKSILPEGYLYFSLRDGYVIDDDIIKSPILGDNSKIVVDTYSNNPDCECDKVNRKLAYEIILSKPIVHRETIYHPSTTRMDRWGKDGFECKVGVKSRKINSEEGNVVSFREGYNGLIKDEFKNLSNKIIDKQHSINCTTKSGEPININLAELREYVLEMDELDSRGNWLNRYDVIRFFDTVTGNNTDEISIKNENHWIGLPNVGKTTIMTILAGFLAKVKGLKTTLVLRENVDVDNVADSLIKCGVKAQPFVGGNLDKYFESRFSKLNDEEDIFDDNILPFYEDSCMIKNILDLDIENMDTMKKENICFSLCLSEKSKYINKPREYKGSFVCPFIMDCPRYHSKHVFKDSDVYLTNIHSFIMTLATKTIFKERVTSMELLAKECDVILFDEADNMQEIIESVFVDEEFVAEGREKGLLELTMDSVEAGINGKKAGARNATQWLSSARNCIGSAEEILHLLSEGVVPKRIMRGTFTSRSLFRYLSSKMVDGVGFRDNEEDDEILAENTLEIDNKKKEIITFYNNYIDKFYMTHCGAEKEYNINDELISKMINVSNYIVGVGKNNFFDAVEKCFDILVDRFDLVIKNESDSDKKRVKAYKKMFQFIIAVSSFEVFYNYTQLNIDMCNEFIEDEALLKNIGYASSFLRHYEGLIPKASAGGQYGLSYHDENGRRSLKLNKYGNIGRYILYNIPNIFKDIDGITTSKTVLFSATSYMPHSTNYHINIKPNYILENVDTSNLNLTYKKMFLEDEEGNILKFSGCTENKKNKVLKFMAKDLCRIMPSGISKLNKIFETTCSGRERVAFTVGSFDEAVMFYTHIEREIAKNGHSNNIKPCIIVSDDNKYANLGLNIFLKSNLDKFNESPYNLAVIVTKSLERGINILTKDELDRVVAAFSTLVYIKRPYIIPENIVDLVCILNSNAMKYYNMSYEQAVELCGGKYTISDFAKSLIRKTHQLQDMFYNRTFYSLMENDMERLNIIANLLVSSHQLEGRFYRGNVPATIIYADGAFFPKEAKGLRQEESYETSIIEGFKWYFELLSEDTTEEGIQVHNIMRKLYGFRIDALNNITYL